MNDGNSPNVDCPVCDGKKLVGGYGCPGFKYIEIPCPQCKGTGEIHADQMVWISIGKALRKKRVDDGISIMEKAKTMGVKPSALSDAEQGRIDPRTIFR